MDKKILIAAAATAAAVIGGISILRNRKSCKDLVNPDLVAAIALASTDMSEMSVEAITVIIDGLTSSLATIKINSIVECEALNNAVCKFTHRANTRLGELTKSGGDVTNITTAYERLEALMNVMETIVHHV